MMDLYGSPENYGRFEFAISANFSGLNFPFQRIFATFIFSISTNRRVRYRWRESCKMASDMIV